jgi:sugar (pentulose or hexulose) kinase
VPDARRSTRLLGVGDDYLHVTHNPVGGVALDWLYELCFRDQTREQFFGPLVEEALRRETRVSLDPPYLGGDRLEIEAHRAAFRDLTLDTDRLDLLAALLREMRRQHSRAVEALGVGTSFRRTFLTGGGAEVVHRLLPEYAGSHVQILEEGSLRGIACLFR